MNTAVTLSSLLVAATAVLVPPAAQAAFVTRNESYPAVTVCQAALPAYEGAIRKRPRAVQNEGTTTAFITCGVAGRGGFRSTGPNARYIIIYLTNVGTASATVSCTALEGQGTAAGFTSSRTVPVGADQSIEVAAMEIDPAAGSWRVPVVSCALPPGTGITLVHYGFVEDNGV